ncbi:disulfide bond formation protein B [Brucella anthropi]|uniref:disulfide bond formation protein B n=1 Tax=Brucella anthropi TaxID=529 RepID=UPI003D998A7C
MKKFILPIGVFSVFVCIIAWFADYSGLVHVCPYCRTERTAIGLLGLAMIMANFKSTPYIFFLNLIAFLGIETAANQIFLGIKRISSGDIAYILNQPPYENGLLLSSLAFIFLSLQIIMINVRRFPKLVGVFQS